MIKLKKIKIIVIEDDAYYAKLLEKHIGHHLTREEAELEYDIRIYQTAQDALQNLEKDTDIVIMDYYLENDNGEVLFPGLDLLRTIKSYCEHCKTVVVSADDNQELTMKLFREGIYEFVVKDKNATDNLSTTLRKIIGDKILEQYMVISA